VKKGQGANRGATDVEDFPDVLLSLRRRLTYRPLHRPRLPPLLLQAASPHPTPRLSFQLPVGLKHTYKDFSSSRSSISSNSISSSSNHKPAATAPGCLAPPEALAIFALTGTSTMDTESIAVLVILQ